MNWKFLSRKKKESNKPKKSVMREWVDAILFAVIASTIIRGCTVLGICYPFCINGRQPVNRRLPVCE
jgi:hypothetical protein